MSESLQYPTFGSLSLEKGSWTAEMAFPSGHKGQVVLEAGNLPVEEFLALAAPVFKKIVESEVEIHQAIVDGLLMMYNDSWRDEDEDDPDPISPSEFIRRIQGDEYSVTLTNPLTSDFSRHIYFGDGSLFAGHFIEVGFSGRGKIIHVGIIG